MPKLLGRAAKVLVLVPIFVCDGLRLADVAHDPSVMARETKNPGAHAGCFCGSEVRIDVVLRAAQPSFQGSYKRVLADLHQSRRSDALLVDDGRTSGNDRFFRYSVKITRPTLDVGTGLI